MFWFVLFGIMAVAFLSGLFCIISWPISFVTVKSVRIILYCMIISIWFYVSLMSVVNEPSKLMVLLIFLSFVIPSFCLVFCAEDMAKDRLKKKSNKTEAPK
jgi:hypothetical protein